MQRVEAFSRAVRAAVRSLATHRVFTAVAVLSLAAALGINTLFLGLANRLYFAGLPVNSPASTGVVLASGTAEYPRGPSFAAAVEIQQRANSFRRTAVLRWDPTATMETPQGPQPVRRHWVSASLFAMLDQRPRLGRPLVLSDEDAGAPSVAVISHRLHTRVFNADPLVLGRVLNLAGAAHTIVGIMPAGLDYPETDIWTPLTPAQRTRAADDARCCTLIAELAEGASWDAANTELALLAAQLSRSGGGHRDTVTLSIVPQSVFARRVLGVESAVPLAILATMVLAAACVNLSAILLARGLAGARETAIRVALGATRGHLVMEFAAQGVVLAAAGGVIGIAGARVLSATVLSDMLTMWRPHIDPTVVAMAIVLTAATGIVFGLAPALAVSRADPHGLLGGGNAVVESPRRSRINSALVFVQVALAVTFVSLTVALASAQRRDARVGVGFDPARLLSLRVELPPAVSVGASNTPAAMRALLASAASATPGVTAASVASTVLLTQLRPITVDHGRAVPTVRTYGGAPRVVWTDDTYLKTLGAPLRRGRNLSAEDHALQRNLAVLNEAAAVQWFSGLDPIGRTVRVDSLPGGPLELSIVGVVGSIRDEPLFQPVAPPAIYTGAAIPVRSVDVISRVTSDDPTIARALERAVSALIPGQAPRAQPAGRAVERVQAGRQTQATAFGVIGLFVALLAMLGLHGIVAMTVAGRTREIGVRIALGAGRTHVLQIVLGGVAGVAIAGTVLGGLLATVAANVIHVSTDRADFISAWNVGVTGFTAMLLVLFACAVPVSRALRIPPARALLGD